MEQGRPFVVTIASEKGGVGKTTLATNLAVYLKALHEDLPVTIVSFDNHFSVDNMFAIGPRRGASMAGLLRNEDPAELVHLGEYGVQYLASERHLSPPDDDPLRLRNLLEQSTLGGILIIDTRPVIDYFTSNALAAADLVIIPIKDRPSLVNAPAILDVFAAAGGNPEHVWLLPSLIDARLKLRHDIGMQAFLTFSGRERGHQVLDLCLTKSPKVESLTTGLSSRIYPVLTHARGTIVHQQFRQLADFVLAEEARRPVSSPLRAPQPLPPGRLRRLKRECPHCGLSVESKAVLFWHDQRSRHRGALHKDCLDEIFGDDALAGWLDQGAILLCCDLDSVGMSGDADAAILRLFDQHGEEIQSRPVQVRGGSRFEKILNAMTGRSLGDCFREKLFIDLQSVPLSEALSEQRYRPFHALRQMVLRHQTFGESSL
ncbi:MAG: ParA family protein [Desulfuromonadales bacterium]|nr:ParA family protein [Desulfuromonadales bacterium]